LILTRVPSERILKPRPVTLALGAAYTLERLLTLDRAPLIGPFTTRIYRVQAP
jgi:hypothetical protein